MSNPCALLMERLRPLTVTTVRFGVGRAGVERVTMIVLLWMLLRTSLDLFWVQLVILILRGVGGVSTVQVVSNDVLAPGCPSG